MPNNLIPMKTLTIGDDVHEIIDDAARTRLDGHDSDISDLDTDKADKSIIGTGNLDTTAKTIIPAINEINAKIHDGWGGVETIGTYTQSGSFTATKDAFARLVCNAQYIEIYDNTSAMIVGLYNNPSGTGASAITVLLQKNHNYTVKTYSGKNITVYMFYI